ncbi:MOB kinase activator 2 isoform X1 [Rhipicephalus microplus]|uniref:MOB kinase activator 2 isoform X1 n=1 Tax=Rhipicephalus microplus TaxID=6941 RepID=UPI0018875702|nr:MOB kinase activator-like 2 isoform X1 [Rhipicephalus microplus]
MCAVARAKYRGMFVLNFVWKARRKDKDASSSGGGGQEEPKMYLESTVLECTIPESRLRDLVDLPEGLDYNEWLASHTLAFFDHINLLYGTVSEFCTMSGCPDMTGPGNRQYLWFDEKGKKCKVAAPQYIDYVMTFTQKTVNDESLFPTKFEREFPSSFESLVKKIHGLLLHVLAHLYHAHFREMVLLQLHGHLHSIFAHFTLFNTRFNLVDPKDAAVLQDLAVALGLCPPAESANGSPAASSSTPTSSAVAAGGSTDEDSAAVDAPACTAAPMDVSLSPSVMQRSVVTTGIATTPLSMTTTPAGSVVPAQ